MPAPAGRLPARLLQAAASLLGGLSLLAFAAFLFAGPFELVTLPLSRETLLVFDAALCVAFFIQHSGMIRQTFRRRLEGVVAPAYHSAIYSVASGAVLLVLVVSWQTTDATIASLHGAPRWLARSIFALGIAGFVWGVRALGSFDAFGAGTIRAHLRGKPLRELRFAVRGPYRWVRHPLYLFSLLLIWSCPDLTVDRLLFNGLFTVWIVVGTWLEEHDLVDQLGDAYRDYQRQVPMLIPWRLRPVAESAPE